MQPVVAAFGGDRRVNRALGVSRPARQLEAAHLLATVDHVRRDVLANTAAARSGVIRRQAFASLTPAAVHTFPDMLASADEIARTTKANASAIVRRACAYMDTHAQDRITMRDVGRAAYVSQRTLQDAFRKHLDSTPTEYLTRVRLLGARDDLRRMDSARGDTVAAVAQRWCFSNGGRFAKLYREQFGMAPQQALRS